MLHYSVWKIIKISFVLIGFSVHQSKSDSKHNEAGILMRSANDTNSVENFVATTPAAGIADGSVDNNIEQQHQEYVNSSATNGSIQQQQQPPSDAESSSGTQHVKSDDLPHLIVYLEMKKEKRTNKTWATLKSALCQSADKFVAAEKLIVEPCSVDNVTFVDMSDCQTVWPNSQNCIKLKFGIHLETRSNTTTTKGNDSNIYEPELCEKHLVAMWTNFGRSELLKNGFKEFNVPDTKKLILLWSSISLAIIGAFILVLFGIWKTDILKDYRRMYWKNSDDEKDICKSTIDLNISMYPVSHQIVPTLFPSESAGTQTVTNTLPFECVSQSITFSQTDFSKRRESVEESLNDKPNKTRIVGEVPFQQDTDYTDKANHLEDEVYFGTASRGRMKYRANTADESSI